MITTGGSVIGLKFKDGVLLAHDTMICYGNTQKFPNKQRCHKVGTSTIVGASGEMADFQYLTRRLDDLDLEDWREQDGVRLGPKQVGSYLGRILYNRRCKGKPLLNQLVVGGWDKAKGEAVLGYCDHQGTCYEEDFIASGFGTHLAIPILRSECEDDKWKNMNIDQAKAVVKKCLQLLFYRDCKASREIQFSVSLADGTCEIGKPEVMDTFWTHPTWTKTSAELAGSGTSW